MSTGIHIIQSHSIHTFFPDFPRSLDGYVSLSNPLYAGFYRDQPFCVVGVVPQFQSGTCAIWGWNTPLVSSHPYIYARGAKRLISKIHHVYPIINGGCTSSKYRWLLSLGATFNSDLTQFRIEASQ
jgi:hypothetical protein